MTTKPELKLDIEKLNKVIHERPEWFGQPVDPEIKKILKSDWKLVTADQLRTNCDGKNYTIFLEPEINFKDKSLGLSIRLTFTLRENTWGKVLLTFCESCAENLLQSKYEKLTQIYGKNLPNNRLTPEERSEAARKAVQARWAKK